MVSFALIKSSVFYQFCRTDTVSVILNELLSYEDPSKTAGFLFIAEQKSFYYNKRKTEMRRGGISEARYARREEGTEDVPGKYGSVGRNHEDEPVQGF